MYNRMHLTYGEKIIIKKRVRENYLELENFWDIIDSFIEDFEYSENKLLTGTFGVYSTKLKGFKGPFGYVLDRIQSFVKYGDSLE